VPAANAAWPGAKPEGITRWPCSYSFLLLIIVAIALGIIGAVVTGLLYLLVIGVVFLADFVFLSARLHERRPAR
jgi:uncharacterized protein (DUF58 family)